MNTFHDILQKSLLGLFALSFAFVTIYVPQNWNQPKTAEAAFATVANQVVSNIEQGLQYIQQTATALYSATSAYLDGLMKWKAFVGDGIAWWAIKLVIAQITRSIVNWINSGFQGAPTFVQDIEGFMLGVGEQIAGLYLQQLGGPLAAFVCAPFRLNIQIAFAVNYQRARSGMPYHTARCNIQSGVLGGFVGGNFNGGGAGTGWGNWLRISTQSNTYTPYGTLMSAQQEAAIRMRTAVSVENRYLQFGNGFFSNKICEAVASPTMSRERCMVSTPGQVISEALNFQLSTGVRSMIAADEINEIIGALMGQVAQTALSGVNGLLGMSSNTGYTVPHPNGSYLEGQITDQNNSGNQLISSYLNEVDKQLAIEQRYLALIDEAIPLLTLLNTTQSVAEAARASTIRLEIEANIITLNSLRADLVSPNPTRDLPTLVAIYSNLILHSDDQITDNTNRWLGLFEQVYNMSVNLVRGGLIDINTYLPNLIEIGSAEALEQVDLINNVYNPTLLDHQRELELIAEEWNNPAIPKVDVLQHYLDLRDGTLPSGLPPLYLEEEYSRTIETWDIITAR